MKIEIPKPHSSLTASTLETLYLNPGERLATDSGALVLCDRPYPGSVREVASLRAIASFGNIALDPEVPNFLLKHQIPLICFGGDGEYLGRLEPDWPTQADVLRAQIELSPEQRLHLTQRIVWGSLRQHRKLMQRYTREGAADLEEVIQKIEFAIAAVFEKDSAASALGCLGSGMAAYYRSLSQCVRIPGWEWQGRDAATPLNAMLGFTYELINQGIITAIAVAGLNSNVGIWRISDLVLDLATEFRVFGDAIVLRAINRRQVALKDFDEWQPSTKRVPERVRQVLVSGYEKKMAEQFTIPYTSLRVSYQEMMLFQSRQLAAYLLEQVPDFCPVSVK